MSSFEIILLVCVMAAVFAAIAVLLSVRQAHLLQNIYTRTDNMVLTGERSQNIIHQVDQMGTRLDASRQETGQYLSSIRDTLSQQRDTLDTKLSTVDAQLGKVQEIVGEKLAQTLAQQTTLVSQGINEMRTSFETNIHQMRTSLENNLERIRQDNTNQLERMRATVDEKLTKTLNDRLTSSFRQVQESLDTVSKGLGEMSTIASGVGDLKRVLSNVKTRGILGEIQLGAILREILAPDQYLENVPTVPGSTKPVEFAVKLPIDGGKPVLLPIDSKFPGDSYAHLCAAFESGDKDELVVARKNLVTTIKNEAKDIEHKYISVPDTTNFAIMFLPFEGLYAEVVQIPGLVEALQRDCSVNVAGPSTMAALLNSLQMSYQTFAFQKRADEIQKVLAAVKAEFPKYQDELTKALKQLKTVEGTVEKIITTRTNVIDQKLKDVVSLEDGDKAEEILGITSRT